MPSRMDELKRIPVRRTLLAGASGIPWQRIVLIMVSALLISMLAALFTEIWLLSMTAGIAGALILSSALENYRDFRAEKISREQTELLLQFLSTEISSGRSLDNAFQKAPEHFAQLTGRQNQFQNGMEQLAAGLKLQIPLHTLLRSFASELKSDHARMVVKVLAAAESGGSDLPQLLGESARMLGDIKRIEREVAAENTQQSTESAILAVLPFAAMFLLRHAASEYMGDSLKSPTGQLMLGISFLMAFASLVMNLRFRTDHKNTPADDSFTSLKRILRRKSPLYRPASLLLRLVPESWILKILAAHRILNPAVTGQARALRETEEASDLNVWLQLKILWVSAALPLSFLLLYPRLPAIYIVILVLAVPAVQDLELISRARRCQNALLQDLPLFISLMKQLLRSGMVLRQALVFTIAQLPPRTPLARELNSACLTLSAGRNASEVLGQFAVRVDSPEIQTSILLLARQETHGGPEILQQLESAARECWSILGSACRKRNEWMRQRLLMPMILDMLAVVLMSAAPALLMFMQN